MAPDLKFRIPAQRSPEMRPRQPHRFADNPMVKVIESTLQQQGVLGMDGGLVACWEDLLPSTSDAAQKCHRLGADHGTSPLKRVKTKIKVSRPRPEEEDRYPSKFARVTFANPKRGEIHKDISTEKVDKGPLRPSGASPPLVKPSTSEGFAACNGNTLSGPSPSPSMTDGTSPNDREAARTPPLPKLTFVIKKGSKAKKQERDASASKDESDPSPKTVSSEVGPSRAPETACAFTQVQPSDLVHTQSCGIQAGPSVCEQGTQAAPQEAPGEALDRVTLEQHLVQMRQLLAAAGRDVPSQSDNALWADGKRLKRLAESQSREVEGINMDTMVYYLHSALKFLEAAHAQEKRKDKRGDMYKGTGNLLMHAAGHMRKHTRLKPFVKKCVQVLAERLAAVAYVRHNFVERRGQTPTGNGTGGLSPLTSPVENGSSTSSTETLIKGLELIQSTAQDLTELRSAAKKSRGAALGAVELISMLGSSAGLGDLRETLTLAQHAIQSLIKFDEHEG
ncbi:unnamed protein product [Ostreobium quekettii]|uniref:Uncharacterized protein n=1 Tax=Ostreobium quekettii TaxID=121088 RepID=A0A8S1ITH3_9CHLO|nr:unnamed protein product [Ostreobium quekettii]|eukprot:evm.model.scf_315.5 EVM.evm.TU.scf_315.5   scf_315:60146-64924(-)